MQVRRSTLDLSWLTKSSCNSISARCPICVFIFCTAPSKCTDRKEAPWGHSPQLWNGADTRARDLSHISPVMSMLLPLDSCQWLQVQARVSLQTTGVAAWLSPGISWVALVCHSSAGSVHFHHRVHLEWLTKGLFDFDQHFIYSAIMGHSVLPTRKPGTLEVITVVVLKLAQICYCLGRRTRKCRLSLPCLWCKTY